jgi:malate synthase
MNLRMVRDGRSGDGGPPGDRFDEILNPDALNLITALHREFGARRHELLAARARRQEQVSAGAMLGFLPETAAIRADSSWRAALGEHDQRPAQPQGCAGPDDRFHQ